MTHPLKLQARRLHQQLKARGFTLSEAQHLIAQAHGHPNWQTAIAAPRADGYRPASPRELHLASHTQEEYTRLTWLTGIFTHLPAGTDRVDVLTEWEDGKHGDPWPWFITQITLTGCAGPRILHRPDLSDNTYEYLRDDEADVIAQALTDQGETGSDEHTFWSLVALLPTYDTTYDHNPDCGVIVLDRKDLEQSLARLTPKVLFVKGT